ncbi:MAG TPA: carboxypeptidase-like regulatory domain-containing protein [Pyrinomonadaceae bacterium]|nr:carboxypeptidase-like regulatory domain-containing protein [Pyrinomonadaceae bacterium]
MALLMFALMCATTAFGQSDRGTITGTVTDPSGAVVGGAKVTATNLETNEVRETVTSEDGNYTLPEVKAGPYRVSVEAQGFKTTTSEDVRVAVQVTRTYDVKLEIGAVSDVVTVTSEASPVIQTESPVRQTNVNERQVKELPLIVSSEFAGRTPLSFIFLDSNVSAATNSGAGTDTTRFRVSGGQALGTEILIDGAATRRTQNGTFFSEVAPGPNAFQEFTLSTSTYSAEFGNSSGGVINFTLKSGGNEFHGEAYDLLRNEKLNANTFRSNAAGRLPNGQERLPRGRDNQNDFGFNVSGPVYLPRFGEGGRSVWSGRDRAFFFFNYEGYRFTQGANTIITVPTARMRAGDFSELLTDPYIRSVRTNPSDPNSPLLFPNGVQIYNPRQPANVREAILGNRLDLRPDLIDRAGLGILQAFPLPNTTGPLGSTVYHNYISSGIQPTNMNQYTTKIDYAVSDKQRITGSYSFRKNDRIALDAGAPIPRFPLPFTSQGAFNQLFKSYFVRLQDDYTFTATLLNHFNIGFTRYDVANQNTTEPFNTSSLGIPINATQNTAFPRVGFPGYGDPVTSSDPRAYQDIGSTFFTDRIRDNQVQITDFMTYVRGRQTIKFGADFRFGQFNFRQRIDPGGTFNFRNDQTAADRDPNGGWPIASLITGATEFAFNFTNSIDPAFRQMTQGYFFQDDIKITQQLTVNIGVRYDVPGLRTEKGGRFRGFDPTAANPEAGGRLGAIAGVTGQGGVRARYETLSKTDYSNFGPRIGFAYSFDNKTVIRGGGGIYYAPIIYGFEGGNVLDTGLIGYNTPGGPYTPDGRNARNFLTSFPSIPPVNPNSQFLGSDVQFFDPNFKTGRTIQWSLDVQRELPANFVASIGYIGHKATRLRSNFRRLNGLPFNALRLGFPVLNMSLAGALADANIVSFAQSVGVPLPSSTNAVFPGFNGTVAQALKPYPQYNRINNLLESQGRSDYNAMQAKLERRFSQGIQFGASYTFSKLLTNASEDLFGGSPLAGVLQNPFDLSSQRSISPNNPAHVLVINYLAELPFGRGKRFLDRGGILNTLFGGFQVSAIHRYQSGTPLSFFTSDPRYTDFLQTAGYLGNLRLNLTGQGLDANEVFISDRLGRQVINPAAFAAPIRFGSQGSPAEQNPSGAAIGSATYRNYYANPSVFFGTVSPTLSGVLTDPFFSEDLSVLKKTRITETITLELGAEAFNLFNRVRFFNPTTDLRDGGNFGFESVNNGPPRVIQLRARVIF